MGTHQSSSPITASRVLDTRKTITSRSGVNKAAKARETLATAQAILEASGHSTAAWQLRAPIQQLSREIGAYYDRQRAGL